MTTEQPEEETFGQRLTYALSELEGHTELTQRELEAELRRRGVIGEGSGYISRYKNDKSVPKPEIIDALAEILHVRRDWLMYGEKPIRRDGRVEPTPFESAAAFARQMGAREDAIKAAWDRHKDVDAMLTVFEWVGLIGDEHTRLEGRPRPESVSQYENDVRRTKKLKAKQAVEAAREKVEPPPGRAHKSA